MKDVLCVQMFGEFSVSWNGKTLFNGARSRESQFASLMQILLHYREEGVERGRLEQILFEERDVDDTHHALRTVIYNAKKKLRQVGLPEVDYFEHVEGKIRWTGEIPVQEDAERFGRLCRSAGEVEDREVKARLYQEACDCYTGEFLPMQAGVMWAAQEARRYRSLFYFCVEELTKLLREKKDFLQMEALGRYAAKICPLADWETVTMEALVSLGRYEDARKLYEDTVDLYLQELGLRPSEKLKELFGRLGQQMKHQGVTVLDQIQAELLEGEEHSQEGFECSYPVFQGIYCMVRRMIERGGQSVYLMLCTIVDSKGNPMRDGRTLEELSQRLGEAIRCSVRRSDAVSQYGKGQYLILLVNITRENCEIIQKRINYHFMVKRQRISVEYHVSSAVCGPMGLGQK